MPSALFDIDDDGEDRGFEATPGEPFTLKLRSAAGATSVVFQTFDPGGFSAELGIAGNPPRASKGAPTLSLEGATTGPAVSPSTVGGEVSGTIGAAGHSYILRCVVNGGTRQLPSGALVPDPTLIHERGIFTRTPRGARKVVATETTQFEIDGWAGALADAADSSELASASYLGQPLVWSVDAEAWVPLGTTAEDVFHVQTLGATLDISAHALSVHLNEGVPMLRIVEDDGVFKIGFFDAAPVARPSIVGSTTQQQVDSLIEALVDLGLVEDNRD